MINQNRPGDGPGFYMLPSTVGISQHDLSRTRSPAFSFGSRPTECRVRPSPGPQSYDVTGLTRRGPCAVPAPLLGSRLNQGSWYPYQKEESPGPGSYSPELYGSIQWKCAVAASRALLWDDPRSSRSRLLARDSKPTVRGQRDITPGPAAYGVTPLDCYKTRQPSVKMAPLHPKFNKPFAF